MNSKVRLQFAALLVLGVTMLMTVIIIANSNKSQPVLKVEEASATLSRMQVSTATSRLVGLSSAQTNTEGVTKVVVATTTSAGTPKEMFLLLDQFVQDKKRNMTYVKLGTFNKHQHSQELYDSIIEHNLSRKDTDTCCSMNFVIEPPTLRVWCRRLGRRFEVEGTSTKAQNAEREMGIEVTPTKIKYTTNGQVLSFEGTRLTLPVE